MKFDEKLMKLRKEKAWSQEEFAEKLDVSRQTVSKWELGQTMPDTNNLTKIASLFGISVNDLLDDNINLVEEKTTKTNLKSGRPFLLILLIIILILALLGIGVIVLNKVFNKKKEKENNEKPKSVSQMFEEYSPADIFNTIFGKIQESENEFDKNSFNNKFKTLYYGTTNGFYMNDFLDEVLKSNDEYSNKLITVQYKDIESNDANDIRALKKQIKTGADDNYEIYYEYDENGYINKAIIEDGNTEKQMSKFDIDRFNMIFKSNYFGSTNGFFMMGFIDNVIKSNEENPEHIITVSFDGTETSDASELRALKKKFSNRIDYEVIYEYDEIGLIKKAIVEK